MWEAVSALVTPNHAVQSARGFRMQAPIAQGPPPCVSHWRGLVVVARPCPFQLASILKQLDAASMNLSGGC